MIHWSTIPGKLPDVEQPLSWRFRVRNWMIRKLAGESVIILNAYIDLIAQTEEGVWLQIADSDNALIVGNGFPPPTADYKILRIREARRVRQQA